MNEMEKVYALLHEKVRTVSQTMTLITSLLDQLLPAITKTDNNIK